MYQSVLVFINTQINRKMARLLLQSIFLFLFFFEEGYLLKNHNHCLMEMGVFTYRIYEVKQLLQCGL